MLVFSAVPDDYIHNSGSKPIHGFPLLHPSSDYESEKKKEDLLFSLQKCVSVPFSFVKISKLSPETNLIEFRMLIAPSSVLTFKRQHQIAMLGIIEIFAKKFASQLDAMLYKM